MQNHGVLLGSGTKKLWAGGAIPYEVVLPSGDWRPFVPTGEKQKDPTETMACVTFATLNSLETQEKQQTGVEPNWSDRFIAKLSGTTEQGNFADKPPETIRQIGLVKQEDWPVPSNYTWATYYTDIPQSVIDKAVKREIAYEAIGTDKDSLSYHLKQCPIPVIIPEPTPNHEVLLVHISGDTAYYFDSYSPYLKTINVSKIHYALKVVLKGNMTKYFKVEDHGKLGIMMLEGFSGTIIFENDFAEYQTLLKITGITDSTPTIKIP
jgi:hypothetical protein